MNDDANPSLMPVSSLTEYFRVSIDAAIQANRVTVDEHARHYVVNMLCLFSRSEALYEGSGEGPRLRPLALMLADAVEAPTEAERNFMLQRLGDVSLFIAGFFADGLQRSAVDLDYYINMGGGAYRSLAGNIRGTLRGEAFGDVFAELAAKFQCLVDVLNEVRDASRATNDEQILRLYEVWLKTRSERAARLLRQLGVEPNRDAGLAYEH